MNAIKLHDDELYKTWRCNQVSHLEGGRECFSSSHLSLDQIREEALGHASTCSCWRHAILRVCARDDRFQLPPVTSADAAARTYTMLVNYYQRMWPPQAITRARAVLLAQAAVLPPAERDRLPAWFPRQPARSRHVLWERGRLQLLFEPRDAWIGWFYGKDAGYLVLVPFFPLRIGWRPS